MIECELNKVVTSNPTPEIGQFSDVPFIVEADFDSGTISNIEVSQSSF